jgi:hypothetical protein
MGLMTATKAFCKLLFNRQLSDSFNELIAGDNTPKLESPSVDSLPAAPPVPHRSDAISLLAALQREARLLDIVTEPLDGYSDAQIGAAAKEVLRDTGNVLTRMFGLQPMTDVADGESLETPAEFSAAEFRLTGNVSGDAPFTGTVAHHGWKATQCDIPKWTGEKTSAMIIAPIELEIKS